MHTNLDMKMDGKTEGHNERIYRVIEGYTVKRIW